jgi:hypothetical protein
MKIDTSGANPSDTDLFGSFGRIPETGSGGRGSIPRQPNSFFLPNAARKPGVGIVDQNN